MTIRILNDEEIPNYLAQFADELTRLQEHARRQPETKPTPPPVTPLVTQVSNLLATLPPAQRERISLPMLLPHLVGKFRKHPHLLHVAKALRQLGYRPIRSWKKSDVGHRYWVPAHF